MGLWTQTNINTKISGYLGNWPTTHKCGENLERKIGRERLVKSDFCKDPSEKFPCMKGARLN